MSKPGPKSALPDKISLADMRYLLGLTSGHVNQLERDGTILKAERGMYSIESIPMYVRAMRKRGAGPDAWNRARTRLTEERALAARQARLEREGKLLPRDACVDVVSTTFRTVRDAFLALGARLAPQLHAAPSTPAVQALLDERIREVLTAVSQTEERETLRRIEAEAARRAKRAPVAGIEDDDEKQAS